MPPETVIEPSLLDSLLGLGGGGVGGSIITLVILRFLGIRLTKENISPEPEFLLTVQSGLDRLEEKVRLGFQSINDQIDHINADILRLEVDKVPMPVFQTAHQALLDISKISQESILQRLSRLEALMDSINTRISATNG